MSAGLCSRRGYFYPRSPCGERRCDLSAGFRVGGYFYPRSPCGERLLSAGLCSRRGYFYPRSPCGERLPVEWLSHGQVIISIHALLAESDFIGGQQLVALVFLSTLSLRRATLAAVIGGRTNNISIHALLAESDGRPPHFGGCNCLFLSTLSLRRAT